MARNLNVVMVAVVFMLLLASTCLIANGKHQEHQLVNENDKNDAKLSRFADELYPHRDCNRQDLKCWKSPGTN